MTEITMQMPDALAARIGASGAWFPTIIELGMTNFRNLKPMEAKAELVEFLSESPTPQQVLDYYISDKNQKRLDYLLDLNGESEINERQREELSEWTRLNHISILLKTRAAKLLKNKS